MSKALDKILDRIQEMGLKFVSGVPTRAHHKLQGQEWDTFLCYEELRYRGIQLHTDIPMLYKGRDYNELCLNGTIKDLAKAEKLEIERCDTFSMRLYIRAFKERKVFERADAGNGPGVDSAPVACTGGITFTVPK